MTYIVGKDYEGVRLDRYLRNNFKDTSLGELFKYIRNGKVKVNGKKSKENYRLELGDVLDIYFISSTSENIENKDKTTDEEFIVLSNKEKEIIKKGIVFETEDLLIFNKPSNMVMHKGSGFDYGVSEMMKSYYKNSNFSFANRIDKSTSGLIIGGKNLQTIRKITELIRDRNITKNYYVLVKGIPKEQEFSIKNYLYNDGKKIIISKQENSEAKYSETKFKVVSQHNGFTILEAELITGRKHQIRVQLSGEKLPIVGDKKYGIALGTEMCLYSYKLVIEELKINIELDVPKYFYEYNN